MTRGEKIAVAVAVAGGMYLLFAKRAPGAAPGGQTVPSSVVNRVMGYAGDMWRYGLEQGVDPALIASVMTKESAGVAGATGAAGEVGLMQIMPATGMWIGNVTPEQLREPAVNIQIGAGYIVYCVHRKGGNVAAGIAGYNYGPDRVSVQNGTVIAPQVVLDYARSVMSMVPEYRRIFSSHMGFVYDNKFPTDALVL